MTAEGVTRAVAALRERITGAGGDPDRITLVAVTKGFGADAVSSAVAAGVGDIGENYAKELLSKATTVVTSAPPRWHFIGRIQRNKIRLLADLVHLWQSVDRREVAAEIAKRAAGGAVLVQVNLTDDPVRAGCPLEEVPGLVMICRDLGLDVRGLMAVAPLGGSLAARPGFRA
ncbi:MAG: YggS family pyridoxal phosphate-dependent enzyme, partial [Acidimicrobiales bacterium]